MKTASGSLAPGGVATADQVKNGDEDIVSHGWSVSPCHLTLAIRIGYTPG